MPQPIIQWLDTATGFVHTVTLPTLTANRTVTFPDSDFTIPTSATAVRMKLIDVRMRRRGPLLDVSG